MKRITTWLVRIATARPVVTLVVLAVLTAAFGVQLRNVRVDNSLENIVDDDNEVVRIFLDSVDRFGGNATLVVCVEADDLLSESTLRTVDDLTNRIEAIPQIRTVTSLTNFQLVRGTDEGLDIAPLIPEIPLTPEDAETVRKRLTTDDQLSGNLVNEPMTATVILAQFHYDKRNDVYFGQVTHQIRGMLADYPGVTFRVAGVPALLGAFNDASMKDIYVLTIASAVLTVLALLFVFRNVSGIALSLVTNFVSIAWVIGLMTVLDIAITTASTMLPTLIMIIAISDVIHMVFQYYEESGAAATRRDALLAMAAKVGPPCLMTSLTTAVGFVSLVISDIIPVRQFGMIAAVGLMITFFIAFTLVPAACCVLPAPKTGTRSKLDSLGTSRALVALGRFNVRRRWYVVAVSALVVVVSIVGITRIRAENNNFDYFKKSDPFLESIRYLDANFAGGNILDVIFNGTASGSLKEPEAMRGMAAVQALAMKFPETGKAMSLTDLVRRMHRAMNADDPAFEVIPDTRELIAQYLLLFTIAGGEGLDSLVDSDYTSARTTFRMREMGSVRQSEIIDEVRAFLDAHPNPYYTAEITGGVELNASLVGYLITSQIESFVLAMVIILAMFVFLFRSVKVALVAMIPNIIPILLALGLMGWTDIPLNMVTVMVASIAIGIAVDDTIHYVARAQLEFRKAGDYDETMFRVLRSTGRAIVFTSVVITLGFSATLLSTFKPPIQFGIVAGTTMIAALFGDLIVLPVILRLTRPFGRATGRSD